MSGLKRTLYSMLAFVAIAVASVFILGSDTITPIFDQATLTVNGPEKFTYQIPYADIDDVALLDAPEYGQATSGKTKRAFAYGEWENAAYGRYTRCTTANAKNCIAITAKDGGVFLFNCESTETTANLYTAFSDDLNKHRSMS